jgi:hypothetical protein
MDDVRITLAVASPGKIARGVVEGLNVYRRGLSAVWIRHHPWSHSDYEQTLLSSYNPEYYTPLSMLLSSCYQ